MSWDDIDASVFKNLVKQITGTLRYDDGELVPYHYIIGVGTIWCYHPSTKAMIRLVRGTKLYVLDMEQGDDHQCLAYTDSRNIIIIDKDEIEEIGFN